MPIKVPDNLPAKKVLQEENIFIMDEFRAFHQDIRPLKIAILNLMPNKETTEEHLLKILANTPLQLEITLLHMESHNSKNASQEHLSEFYKVFDDIRHEKFDGMIMTGAPIELLDFEEVTYWKELTEIMDWSKTNVTSTLHICWGAQSGLYYHYGVDKYPLEKKMFGIFKHSCASLNENLLRGFDDEFFVPHSRHTSIKREDILKVDELKILSESEDSGVYIVMSKNGRQIFVTGHSEYDPLALKREYLRDIGKGMDIDIPKNYFPDDNPENSPKVKWRSHANLLFNNWLNYYVYQETPFNIEDIHRF